MTWAIEYDSDDTTGADWWMISNEDGSRWFRAFEKRDAEALVALLNALPVIAHADEIGAIDYVIEDPAYDAKMRAAFDAVCAFVSGAKP